MYTPEELKKLETSQLMEALNQAKKELFKITFEVTNGQAKNSHDIGKNRKYIARIETILNAKKSTT